jgi:cytidylate kinase
MIRTLSTIAIDGPAGSGKSTIGSGLAQRLGFLYFDTGVMYRCVALAALENEINLRDEEDVSRLAELIRIEVKPSHVSDGRQYSVFLDERDVTWLIRSKEVESNVSMVSAYPRVREAMVKRQREIAKQGNIVMVGRDIGTVVLPNADAKIYLDATAEERARRRQKELIARGQNPTYEEVLAAVLKRDDIDMHRATSPLRPAADAIIVDCTNLSADETLDTVTQLLMKDDATAVVSV